MNKHEEYELTFRERMEGIELIKNTFTNEMCKRFNLLKVVCPIFVEQGTGLQDDMAGSQEPVSFCAPSVSKNKLEIVHSLAKWKRHFIASHAQEFDVEESFGIGPSAGNTSFVPSSQLQKPRGILTDMHAIRQQEDKIDEQHSIKIEQFDWEMLIPSYFDKFSKSKQEKQEEIEENVKKQKFQLLKDVVAEIYEIMRFTEAQILQTFPKLLSNAKDEPVFKLNDKIQFIHAEELEAQYQNIKSSSEREKQVLKDIFKRINNLDENFSTSTFNQQQNEKRIFRVPAVFIIGIGLDLPISKKPHSLRAFDYDDWSTEISEKIELKKEEIEESIDIKPKKFETEEELKEETEKKVEEILNMDFAPSEQIAHSENCGDDERIEKYFGLNGDILIYDPIIDDKLELSSMGVRVDKEALLRQAKLSKIEESTMKQDFHQKLLSGEIPNTIGGGIGIDRLTMLILRQKHIGQVQVSVWPQEQFQKAKKAGYEIMT